MTTFFKVPLSNLWVNLSQVHEIRELETHWELVYGSFPNTLISKKVCPDLPKLIEKEEKHKAQIGVSFINWK